MKRNLEFAVAMFTLARFLRNFPHAEWRNWIGILCVSVCVQVVSCLMIIAYVAWRRKVGLRFSHEACVQQGVGAKHTAVMREREKKRVAGEYGESSSSVESRTSDVVRDQQKFLFSQAHFHHSTELFMLLPASILPQILKKESACFPCPNDL